MTRALTVLAATNNLQTAARTARISEQRLERTANRKQLIKKRGKGWRVSAKLSRQILIYSAGREIPVTVTKRSARTVGKYMAAVGRFLRTNNATELKKIAVSSVKDTTGRRHPFEFNPNVLYRLASTGSEPFEDVYRIVV